MLNESYELARSMEGGGIKTVSWHKKYKPLPKGKTFRVRIDPNGGLAGLDPLPGTQGIRKWETANGESFPAFNVPKLWLARSEEAQQAMISLRKRLKKTDCLASEAKTLVETLRGQCESQWKDNDKKRIRKCLDAQAKKLGEILGAPPDDCRAIVELIRRAQLVDVDTLKEFLDASVLKWVATSPADAWEWINELWVSTAFKNTSVVLELAGADAAAFSYPANHHTVIHWINARLLGGTPRAEQPGVARQPTGDLDAFGGPGEDIEDKFPSMRLGHLGGVILRAMNSESPCQRRYDRADAASFPLGKENRQRLKDSLEWLADPERQGKTWANVSGCELTAKMRIFCRQLENVAIPEFRLGI